MLSPQAPAKATAPAHRTPVLLWVIVVAIATAAFREVRLYAGGLLIPAYVLPLMLTLPAAVRSFRQSPMPLRAWTLFFSFLFALGVIRYGSDFGELPKLMTALLMLFACAGLVRSREDLVEGALALAVALIIINLNGIRNGLFSYVGYEPFKGVANKNAYSLYALPALLLSTWVLLYEKLKLTPRLVHLTSIVSTAFILFTGANRSGWLGAIVIAMLLAVQARRWRVLVTLGVLGALSFGAISLLGTETVFEYRVNQTREGYSSDAFRVELALTALEEAADNPIFGVTPQALPTIIAARTSAFEDEVDTHNITGYLAAGFGFPALLAFAMILVSLWKGVGRRAGPANKEVLGLLRIAIVLFVIRGQFSREILFSPAFMVAFGLPLGLLLRQAGQPPVKQIASAPAGIRPAVAQ